MTVGSRLCADRRFKSAGLAATGLWLLVRSALAHTGKNHITLASCALHCSHDEDPYALANLLVTSGLWEIVSYDGDRPSVWRMIDHIAVKDTSDSVNTFGDVKSALVEGNPTIVCDLPEIRSRAVMLIVAERGLKRSDLRDFSSWLARGNYKQNGRVPTFVSLTNYDMAALIEALGMWQNSKKRPTKRQEDTNKTQQATGVAEKADVGKIIGGLKRPNA